MESNKKIRVAVVGYGNIGKCVIEATLASPDMELVGIVRRNTSVIPSELKNFMVVDSINKLNKVDVAILCTPTRRVEDVAVPILESGINTVDSFDNHSGIVPLRQNLDKAAKKGGAVSVMSAGWDPGTDSIVRALFEICAPEGVTYTNFGPGMSMGHTVAVKAIEGVKAALSMTLPVGTSLHRRMVYVELEPGHNLVDITSKIKSDPYFVNDETHVKEVPDVSKLLDTGHGVNMVRKGVSGSTHNQRFEFNMSINNPALTGQIMVASARASVKQPYGAYTMIEIAPIDFLSGNREELIARFV